ncbi:hypothetical protein [Pseudomonas sp. NBRC 100443]|uniref:hypothetical protein n=1 Tax=Pseudomonas sp. NBRC 100443 TaxID=1113665 RepID=UPI0024A3469A|nr:hypothetical protein [Pseudomonas sp. NBRC 100443]GLU38853.1 hypothetical protein Pssp01_29460 [Pseudomonas sp. NBRC 100443]
MSPDKDQDGGFDWAGLINESFTQGAISARKRGLAEEAATFPPASDTVPEQPHTATMTDPISRPELDAKLEAIEARMDARIARIESAVSGFQSEASQFRAELSSAKWWAIGTAIAVLAIFLGTLQWGLSAQKEENARFSSYIRDDVKDISSNVQEIAKSVGEMRIKAESQRAEQKQ